MVEADLIAALRAGRIAGAGIDLFDVEPPAADHPFRSMDNVTVTPHLDYVTRETLTAFHVDTLRSGRRVCGRCADPCREPQRPKPFKAAKALFEKGMTPSN